MRSRGRSFDLLPAVERGPSHQHRHRQWVAGVGRTFWAPDAPSTAKLRDGRRSCSETAHAQTWKGAPCASVPGARPGRGMRLRLLPFSSLFYSPLAFHPSTEHAVLCVGVSQAALPTSNWLLKIDSKPLPPEPETGTGFLRRHERGDQVKPETVECDRGPSEEREPGDGGERDLAHR